MTNDQYIATQIEGLCWHEYNTSSAQCLHCPAFKEKNPAYSSPDSPRSLLDAVERKAVEKFGPLAYRDALVLIIFGQDLELNANGQIQLATASADVRCAAIRSLYEQGGKE